MRKRGKAETGETSRSFIITASSLARLPWERQRVFGEAVDVSKGPRLAELPGVGRLFVPHSRILGPRGSWVTPGLNMHSHLLFSDALPKTLGGVLEPGDAVLLNTPAMLHVPGSF